MCIYIEVKVANKARVKVAETGQGVLDRYRASHTPEEIEADSSIIGHLVRSPYPTELDRIADVTIFMLAGHDTTGLYLILYPLLFFRCPSLFYRFRSLQSFVTYNLIKSRYNSLPSILDHY
jgi:hypothetical protein